MEWGETRRRRGKQRVVCASWKVMAWYMLCVQFSSFERRRRAQVYTQSVKMRQTRTTRIKVSQAHHKLSYPERKREREKRKTFMHLLRPPIMIISPFQMMMWQRDLSCLLFTKTFQSSYILVIPFSSQIISTRNGAPRELAHKVVGES